MLAAGALFAGDLAFWHLSIVYTTVANATLLSNFAPVFVALGGWLLFGHRVTRLFLVALAISVIAVVAGLFWSRPPAGAPGREAHVAQQWATERAP